VYFYHHSTLSVQIHDLKRLVHGGNLTFIMQSLHNLQERNAYIGIAISVRLSAHVFQLENYQTAINKI
jgi:hypothetical protein